MLEEEAAKPTLDQVVMWDFDLKGIISSSTIHCQINAHILKILLDRLDQLYVELQDQWNGPYFFFLKSIAQPPWTKLPQFFFYGVFP